MKKLILIVVVVIAAAVAGYFFLGESDKTEEAAYEFTTLKTGDLTNTVSATGTIEPVGVVEVGTQVSGTLETVLVDYNDNVRTGQILAVMDRANFKAAYTEAEASFRQSKADLRKAESDYNNQKILTEREMGSQNDLLEAEVALEKARAALDIAKSRLDKADLNLNTYSIIRSPIDGKVISRSVEPGQTVAASLSAPVLFKIAQNLEEMEIHALVDESDIGLIIAGQQVEFTVETHSDSVFKGVAKAVYLEPETVSNVVNYTVVVSTTNPDGLLLPGMTATCEFIISGKKNVLQVDNAALSLTPTQEMLAELQKNRKKDGKSGENGFRGRNRQSNGGEGTQRNGNSENMKRLWYIDARNQLQVSIVKTGVSDGVSTEVMPLRPIPDDAKIIKKVNGGTPVNERGPRMMSPRLL